VKVLVIFGTNNTIVFHCREQCRLLPGVTLVVCNSTPVKLGQKLNKFNSKNAAGLSASTSRDLSGSSSPEGTSIV